MTDVDSLITEHIDIWTGAIKKRNSQGRGSNKKIELTGVKKLRELILELAIKGKLEPQNPNDEHASILLEKIAKEKERLVAEKKIKKPKGLPEIGGEQRESIPEGWGVAYMQDITKVVTCGIASTPKYHEKGKIFLSAKNVKPYKFMPEEHKFVDEETFRKITKKAKPEKGDILLTRVGAGIGEAAVVDIDIEFAFYVSLTLVKPFLENFDSYFLLLWLNSPQGVKKSIDNIYGRGVSAGNLNVNQVRKFEVPIPPLAEQHRIVAKVDELMVLCDQLEQQTENSITAHKTLVETLLGALTNSANAKDFNQSWKRIAQHFDILFTTEDSIDQLKQTILQLAVMGKLVPQDPSDEPASVLLEKIAKEKERLIKEGKIKKQKVLSSICDDDIEFNIPNRWKWVRFGQVTTSRLGKMLDKAKNKGRLLPYLRNTNVQWHNIDLDDIKLMRIEDEEIEELMLKTGDLLICEGGYPGRCAIWKGSKEKMFFQKALHRARPFGGMKSDYLQLCLTIDSATKRLDRYFTGATIQHFTGIKLNNYVIPLPPEKEQHRIVAKVDELMALCDQLKVQLSDAQTTQLHLADAIVEQAVG